MPYFAFSAQEPLATAIVESNSALTTPAETAKLNLGQSMSDESCYLIRKKGTHSNKATSESLVECDSNIVGVIYEQKKILSHTEPVGKSLRDVIMKEYSSSPAYESINSRMRCIEPNWLRPTANEAKNKEKAILGLGCNLKNGGWPQLILLRIVNSQLKVAEGPPSLLPVLLRGMDQGSDSPSLDTNNNFENSKLLRAVWGIPVRLFAAKDQIRYENLIQLAHKLNGQQKYEESETLLRQALELQTELLGADAEPIVATLIDLALELSNNRRFEESAALYRRAETILQKSTDETLKARYLAYLGYDSANRGVFDDALKNIKASIVLWRKIAENGTNSLASLALISEDSSPSDQEDLNTVEKGELAMALNFEALMALKVEDLADAQISASESLQILQSTKELPVLWRPQVLSTLGDISLAQGRMAAADTYFSTALQYLKQINIESIETVKILMKLATGFQAEGLPTSAIVTFREAIKMAAELTENSVGAFTNDQLTAFAASVVSLADAEQDIGLKRALYAEAFQAFQMTRSNVIEKTMIATLSRQITSDPDLSNLLGLIQTQERGRDADKAELAFESTLPDNKRDSEREATLLSRIKSKEQRVSQLRKKLEIDFPGFNNSTSTRPVELEALQSALFPTEGVLSIIVGSKDSYAQLVTRGDIKIVRVRENLLSIAQTIQHLRLGLDIEGGSVNEFDLDGAHTLYRNIFSDLKELLSGVKHLIVISNGALSSLPLSLLVTEPSKPGDYVNTQWLGKKMATSYSPSLKSFLLARQTSPKTIASKMFLGFGDPKLMPSDAKSPSSLKNSEVNCRKLGPAPASLLMTMASLPDTAIELKTISSALKDGQSNNVFLGSNATETNLRAQKLDDYRVLYFATHGLLPGELKCQEEPALVLTPPPTSAKTKEEDGLLEASEIAALKINADLVVLSACNTGGSGGKFGGDALSGLAESFFHAGARSLLVSQWQVPSKATTQLMTGVFKKLGPDLNAGGAFSLQESQISMMSIPKTAHPVFWAAFEWIGDGGRLTDQVSNQKAQGNTPKTLGSLR